MRYLTIIFMCVLSYHNSHSQIYEIGGFLGGSNFIGDVGSTNYISPNKLAFGGIVKWNRSPRHSYRFSIIYSELEGKDSKSHDPRRTQRDYSFSNSILEISAGMEFTFFDFNLHYEGHKSTPYMFAGISAARHDDFYFSNDVQTSQNTLGWAWGIPMGLGYKTTITDHLILAAEIGARYTFSDELDGSFPKNAALSGFAFGNINNNDWYMFTGITLTYTFARKPCYCDF